MGKTGGKKIINKKLVGLLGSGGQALMGHPVPNAGKKLSATEFCPRTNVI